MLPAELVDALATDGLRLDAHQVETLHAFLQRVRAAQPRVSLVSEGDLPALEAKHLPDCLALAAVVNRGSVGVHLDIGSGGGFPGVVLAVALPERPVLLLERSEKKSVFLRETVAALGLKNATVVWGEFPVAARGLGEVSTVSARAVEQPEKILRKILRWLPSGATFYSQFAVVPLSLPEGVSEVSVAALASAKHRRGTLRAFRRG